MAIKSGDFLGTFTGTNGGSWPLYAIAFSATGKLYPAQEVEVTDAGGGKIKGYVIMSLNFVKASSNVFKQAEGITDALVTEAFEASKEGDVQGFEPPAGFTTPIGWAARGDGYGTIYYVNLEDLNLDGIPDSQAQNTSVWSANGIMDFVKQNWPYVVLGLVVVYLVIVSGMPKRKRKKWSLGLL